MSRSKVQPDFTFTREGRPLHAWLAELISADAAAQARAGDAVMAMFYGLPSIHTDLEDVEGGMPTGEAQQAAWRNAVREAVARPEFPRRQCFIAAAGRLVGLQAEMMRELTRVDEQFDRIVDRLAKRRDLARSEDERMRASRRIGRAICASCERDERRRQPAFDQVCSMTNFAMQFVIEFAGPALLEAPEALWMLLESRGQEYLALKAIATIGPPATAEFGDWLLEQYDANPNPWANGIGALTSVLRDDPRLHQRLIDALEAAASDPPLPALEPSKTEDTFHQTFYHTRAWSAAMVVSSLSPGIREVPGIGPRLLPAGMALTRSPRPGHRAAGATVVGALSRDGATPDEARAAVERLLELSSDHPWVAGRAIEMLGHLHAMPRVVVPRLIELFDAFEEFDPDEGYGGSHARVCRALARFGADAAAAVPRLARELRQSIAEDADTEPQDLVQALVAIGPAAAEALPDLERLAAARGSRGYDEPDVTLAAAMRRIRGG
jgi:hypothetical protein